MKRTTSPYDVVEAFSGLAERSEDIDTDELTKSLNTLAALTENTPEEFRSALSGLSDLSPNIAARDEQLDTLLAQHPEGLHASWATAARTSSR